MNAKLVTTLSGASQPVEFQETGGILQQVIEEKPQGYFRSTKLGAEAVLLKRGEHVLIIPLPMLWDFAEQQHPALVAKPPVQETPAEPATPLAN